MAVDRTPVQWLGPNASLAASQLKFNTASNAAPCLPDLTDVQANMTTGDIGQIMMTVLNKCYVHWQTLAQADRPTKFTMTRQTTENQLAQTTRIYQISFVLDETLATAVDPEV